MQEDQGGIGPLIGSIVVIALIVLGGYYVWKESRAKMAADQAQSDELPAIESGLSAASAYSMDFTELDQASAQ